jgi:hypothetical protein
MEDRNSWIILRARFRVQDDVDQEEPHPQAGTRAYLSYVEESDDAVD